MSKSYFLIVHTNTYTGNIDSFLTGLLFEYDDDRFGAEHGMKSAQHLGISPVGVDLAAHPDSKYELPYKLFGPENKSLEYAIECDSDEYLEELVQTEFAEMKTNWAGKDIPANEEAYVPTFTILGFSIRTEIATSEIKDL